MLFATENQITAAIGNLSWERWVWGTIALIAATGYVFASMDRGWIPHDEGQLGHTAERIISGELPHRDFVEPYTGGLSYLHAAAFRVFGLGSHALRWTLLPFFAVFALCTYWIACRAAAPWLAAAITFLCACLTLPVYPASMPSWYNLFAAVCGAAALLRYLDTGHARWACLAGLLAGLSIVVKITGLYFVAAALLFLVYREQQMSSATAQSAPGSNARSTSSVCASSLISLFLILFGALGFVFVRPEKPLMDVVHFMLPFVALAGMLLQAEWRQDHGAFAVRFARFGKSLGPFLIGVTIPIALLTIVYWRADALYELYQGVLVLPGRRLAGAQMALPSPVWLVMAAPWTMLLAVGFLARRPPTKPIVVTVFVALVTLFCLSHTDRGHLAIFQGLRNQLPILLAFTLVVLASRFGQRLTSMQRHELLLLAAVAFLVSLVQFPYSGGFYFFYAAPPAVLLALFLVRSQPHAPRAAHGACLVFVIMFLVCRVHNPGPAIAGGPYRPDTTVEKLALERCDLTVRADQALLYEALVTTIQAHSAPGSYIYATPDCPEVYFFAGRRNPTKTTYELFDDRQSPAAVFDMLEAHNVQVVVLKQFSEFSRQLDAAIVAGLQQRFGGQQVFHSAGHDEGFVVMWRL